MSSHNLSRWFTNRTSQQASLYVSMQETDEPIQPTFWRKSFLFLENEEPEHINQYPLRASIEGTHEVYGMSEQGDRYHLAIDISDFSVAALLARARVRHLEKSAELGYHEGVYILRPDGTEAVVL